MRVGILRIERKKGAPDGALFPFRRMAIKKKKAVMATKATPEQVMEACRAQVVSEMAAVLKGIVAKGKKGSVPHARFLMEFAQVASAEAMDEEEDISEKLLREIENEMKQ